MDRLGHTEHAISILRRKCVDLHLENACILDKYTDSRLAEIYNGIGPDSFPDWAVGFLDDMAPELAPVCLIHDVEWLESDGTMASFKASNDRLRRNGKIVAKTKPWWNPMRYIIKIDAKAFSKACQKFGFDIWKSYAEKKATPASCGMMVMYVD